MRYRVHSPRVVYRCDFATETNEMTICVDSDFAGCIRTRHSTSGGMVFVGHCLVKHWGTTQTTVALSSGETELVGVVKGAAQGVGFQASAADLGISFKIKVMSDPTAAISICRRRGLGRASHIAVSDVLLQERLKTCKLTLCNTLGCDNPADFLTKIVETQTLQRLMTIARLDWELGRPPAAPALTHAIMHNIGHGLCADGAWFPKPTPTTATSPAPSTQPTPTSPLSSISKSVAHMVGNMMDLQHTTVSSAH